VDVRPTQERRSAEGASLYQRVGGHEGIAKLLRHFYADVRQHRLIGPIFNERIEDWPEHLAKIGEFWARATGGPSRYSGQMPLKHLTLGLEPTHFGAWLELWDANCRSYLPPREAEEMSMLAHGIGQRLRTIIGAGSAAKAG
jgi:hemoglobin